jgi:hypothetical protein
MMRPQNHCMHRIGNKNACLPVMLALDGIENEKEE